MPTPHKTVDRPKNLKVSAKIFLKSLKPYRLPIIVAIIFAVGSTILSIFGPRILGQMTTDAMNSFTTSHTIDWTPITSSIITLIILYSLSGLFGYLEGIILGRVAAKYSQATRFKILEKINRLPISYFDKNQYGDTLSRMSNDVDVIGMSLQNSLTETISNLVMLVGILIMMFTISPVLSLIALIAVPFSSFFIAKVAKKAQKYFLRQQNTLGRVNSIIEEDYSGHIVIKSNSHEQLSQKKFDNTNHNLYETTWKAQFYSSLAFPITHICTSLSYVAVCIFGGYQAINGQITIGDFQAFIQYTNQFNRPISQMAQIISTIQLALAASERIHNFLQVEEEAPDTDLEGQLADIDGHVSFDTVNFSYLPEKPVITNFSCNIKPGQKIALVGPTGAGKTTIVNLLMRFYDPNSGSITIDGHNTANIKRNTVRSLFGMVLQDTWLFSGTIEENLRYGKADASHEEIVKACKETHVDHFIKALPHGYRTRISEDSDNISAGEKQLLTIARAMIADPPMMILDEATSNVDTRTEQLIQDAFDKLTKNRTSFIIAHRLSTIRNADLILVMKNGNIVEQGSHAELLKQGGFYAELYNSQFEEA